jgi:low affinity Fe/Cu permease
LYPSLNANALNSLEKVYCWDSKAIHLKLNEIILAIESVRNQVIALEEEDDREAIALQKEFKQIKKDDPSCP